MLRRIISGGQTGVDRGALDAAMDLDLEHGGTCPRGRRAEDGQIPEYYELDEHESPRYHLRTEQNVVDADATLIVFDGALSGGTEFTHQMTRKHNKPCLLYDLRDPPDLESTLTWMRREQVEVLNCAGPRESSCPGIARLTRQLCSEIFRAAIDDAS